MAELLAVLVLAYHKVEAQIRVGLRVPLTEAEETHHMKVAFGSSRRMIIRRTKAQYKKHLYDAKMVSTSNLQTKFRILFSVLQKLSYFPQ